MDYSQLESLQPVVFLSLLVVISIAETIFPFSRNPHRLQHFRRNMTLTLINSALNLALRGVLAAAAAYASTREIGLLNGSGLPKIAVAVLGLFVLDFSNYLMHRLKHSVPFLWRFHRVHHTDAHLDVTTGVRFHPGETLFSILFQMGVVVAFGIPFWTLVLYFLVLSAAIQINHSNIRWPIALDQALRLFFVSPYMHKTHHSRVQRETDTNFGDIFPYWDKLMGTYYNRREYQDLSTGLDEYGPSQSVLRLLRIPFQK